jgi:hypothetical protein
MKMPSSVASTESREKASSTTWSFASSGWITKTQSAESAWVPSVP